jgi:hypothetical protein
MPSPLDLTICGDLHYFRSDLLLSFDRHRHENEFVKMGKAHDWSAYEPGTISENYITTLYHKGPLDGFLTRFTSSMLVMSKLLSMLRITDHTVP